MHIEMKLGSKTFSLMIRNPKNLLEEGACNNSSTTCQQFYNYLSFFGHSTYCAKLLLDEPLYHGASRCTWKYEGGPKWETLTVFGLKVFMAIHMYMDMKKQPNYKSYWEKEGTIFHCPIISNIMTKERFIQLHRCLHIKIQRHMSTFQKVTFVIIN
jgi:hypothetical protein